MARTYKAHGYLVVRPNFRGVGATAGQHDGGHGETNDTLTVIRHFQEQFSAIPLALAGFSFGAFVQAVVARQLSSEGGAIASLVLAGMPVGTVGRQRSYDTPPVPADTLLIHGEADSVVPPRLVLDWARPQDLPIVLIPGANHFFTGHLKSFTLVIARHLAGRPGFS
jgi:uncharacterized protein